LITTFEDVSVDQSRCSIDQLW